MKTTERLAEELKKASAPFAMVERARLGYYDDFKSPADTPIMNLIHDLNIAGLADLAKRAMNGEFDATREEAEEWFQKETIND